MDEHGVQADLRPEQRFVLQRNCCMKPLQLLSIFGVLALLSLAVAGFWASQGAWVAVPFAVLEVLALGVAFLVYARHAADSDDVSIYPQQVEVVLRRGPKSLKSQLPRGMVRVDQLEPGDGLIRLSAGRREVVVGRFVEPSARSEVVDRLRAALRSGVPASA